MYLWRRVSWEAAICHSICQKNKRVRVDVWNRKRADGLISQCSFPECLLRFPKRFSRPMPNPRSGSRVDQQPKGTGLPHPSRGINRWLEAWKPVASAARQRRGITAAIPPSTPRSTVHLSCSFPPKAFHSCRWASIITATTFHIATPSCPPSLPGPTRATCDNLPCRRQARRRPASLPHSSRE